MQSRYTSLSVCMSVVFFLCYCCGVVCVLRVFQIEEDSSNQGAIYFFFGKLTHKGGFIEFSQYCGEELNHFYHC